MQGRLNNVVGQTSFNYTQPPKKFTSPFISLTTLPQFNTEFVEFYNDIFF